MRQFLLYEKLNTLSKRRMGRGESPKPIKAAPFEDLMGFAALYPSYALAATKRDRSPER